MQRTYYDQPVTGEKDSPDRLNREEFASRISKILRLGPDSPGLVLSLEGEWGSGKTSLINLALKQYENLKEDEKPIIVNFNPWLIGDSEHLINQLLTEIASKITLKDKSDVAKNLASKLTAYSKIFSFLKFFPEPTVAIGLVALEKALSAAGDATKAITDLHELNLEEKRSEIEKAIKDFNKPIIIIIDDFDRLPPKEAFEIIRLVKAATCFPKTAYLLAFDSNYIEEALASHGIAKDSSYLEKIIQVRLHLPKINPADLQTILDEVLIKLPDNYEGPMPDENKDRVAELYSQGGLRQLLETPRDIKRILNRVIVNAPALAGEVTLADQIGLETLAIKASPVYEHIRRSPEAYIGIPEEDWKVSDKQEEVFEKHRQARDDVVNTLPTYLKEYILRIVGFLFPATREHGDHNEQSFYSQRGRIASAERLRVALTFGLPQDEISFSLIENFINATENREKIIESIPSIENLRLFIDRLNESILEKPDVSEPIDFLLSLGMLAEHEMVCELQESSKTDLVFGAPILRIYWIATNFLEYQPENEIFPLLKPLYENDEDISLATETLHSLVISHRKYGFGNNSNSTDRKLIKDDELDKLVEIWLKNAMKVAQDCTVFAKNAKRSILLLLPRFEPDTTKEIVNGYFKNDKNFDLFILAIRSFGTSSAKGRFVFTSKKILEDFGKSIDEFKKRIEERQKSEVPINGDLALIHKSILTEKEIYLVDASEVM